MPTQAQTFSSSATTSRSLGLKSMLDALDDEPVFVRNLIKDRLQKFMNERNASSPIRTPHYNQPVNLATARNRRTQPGLSTQEMLTLLAAFAAPEPCEA